MSDESSVIKNSEVYRQIDKKTKDDPVMRDFLREVVGMGSLYSYKSRYDTAIDKAIKRKESIK